MMGLCQDLCDDLAMTHHLRQHPYAAATAIPMSMHPSSSMPHPRMSHPSLARGPLHGLEGAHQQFVSEHPMLPRAMKAYSPDCHRCPPDHFSSDGMSLHESLARSDFAEMPRECWNQQYNSLRMRVDTMPLQSKRSAPVFEAPVYELDDPLCQTPPMLPLVNASNQRLSPFELEEKRPTKFARQSNVLSKSDSDHSSFKPQPPKLQSSQNSLSLPGIEDDGLKTAPPSPPNLSSEKMLMPLTEAECFDFFEALLAM